MRAIVIYATQDGQTDRIGHEITDRMIQGGLPTDHFNVTEHPTDRVAIDWYDAVVLGSPVHWGQLDPKIGLYLDRYQRFLKFVPAAFFTVSLQIASEQIADQNESRGLLNSFLNDHRFKPDMTACFAGALKFSRYGWLKKHMMHWVADQSNHLSRARTPTDLDRDCDQADCEYTNWDYVDQFADQFVSLVTTERAEQSRRQQYRMYSF